MNWFNLVLGDTWVLVLPAAMLVGAFSGILKADALTGAAKLATDSDSKDIFLKSGLAAFLITLIYFDSDDLTEVFFRVTVPLGIYKIIQMFVTCFFVWRKLENGGRRARLDLSDG